jgi:malonyl-CoA O-methyltransferase
LLDRWLGRGVIPVAADLAQLPLQGQCVQLVWSNMALHWLNDPLSAFREFSRVLATEGLLMFSTLGPDTLKELRAAGASRVHGFTDMHDLGDMLVAAGFTNPVMEMEIITIDYGAGARLLDDLRRSGQTNARADRPRGLSGRRFGERVRSVLERSPRITFEVVYGHAWKPAPRVRGQTAVTLEALRAELGARKKAPS